MQTKKAKTKAKVSKKTPAAPLTQTPFYCSQPRVPEMATAGMNDGRVALILQTKDKWVNGTTLRYFFFDDPSKDFSIVKYTNGTEEKQSWLAPKPAYKDVVRKAFKLWKNLGIGLNFEEVSNRKQAQVRIAFQQDGSSWSYLGRQVLDFKPDLPTMNLGWNITGSGHNGIDTAIHEIGHTLGFPHEHQNPFSGIVWDEEAVYADLAEAPNNWDRDTTYWNILRKIKPDEVKGSTWDPNSIMHYPFKQGLILSPKEFKNGISPAGGFSAADREWVRHFYPPISVANAVPLLPLQSQELTGPAPSTQSFLITPDATREYQIRTVGTADTLLVIFEKQGNKLVQLAADDDSGGDRNALLKLPLVEGRKYVLKTRLNFISGKNSSAIILL